MAASRTRLALMAGAAGLAGGLALGVTGLASAADPSPGTEKRELRQHFKDHGRPFGERFGPGMGKRHGSGGLVQSVGASSITVLTHEGTKTIALNDDTSYYVGRTKATRSAVKQGLVVGVRLVDPRADRAVAAVVSVVPAHVAGWVTAISEGQDGSTVTVTDLSGFTRTIRTDGSTVYVKDGETATKSIVTKGAFVRATGQVAENGTTLEADRVAVGRPLHKRDGDRPPPAAEPST